jgi:hypothetical protein
MSTVDSLAAPGFNAELTATIGMLDGRRAGRKAAFEPTDPHVERWRLPSPRARVQWRRCPTVGGLSQVV